jgi:hypothetical protein
MGQPGRTAITVRLRHDIWDMTSAMTLDRTTQTGQSGQVGLTGQAGQDRLTGQPGQIRQDRAERMGCQNMTTKTGLWGQVSSGQDQWSRTAGKGQAGQDRRTGQGRTGQI